MNEWVNCHIFGFSEAAKRKEAGQGEWTASKAVLKKTRSRITFILILFVCAYVAVIARMTILTFTSHQFLREEEVTKEQVAETISKTRRADIYDREGKLLATSLKTQSLYADPRMILDAQEAARKLSAAFPDLAYDDTFKKLSSKRRFVWLKRNLTPKQIYVANSLGLPGVDFLEETRRVYPQGSLTSHVLGYTDIDNKGLSGIERGLNDALLHSEMPMETTLDIRLQHILHREIRQSITDFNAIGGAGLVMNVHTGEIEAMVSLPDYNPHQPGSIGDLERFNRITLGAYEMGSTFKMFTAAAALENRQATIHSRYNAIEPIRRGGFTIRDYRGQKRVLSMPEVLIYSSNIGAAMMAEKVGTSGMQKFFANIGLFDRPQFEIKEQAAPLLPKPWREINTVTASYGHGIAVTPLQLAAGYASLVNGGYKIKPTLLKHPEESYQQRERVLSDETSRTIREMMRLVATDGSASKANQAAKGYRVGGKTGTAEKTLGRGYSKKAQIASFVGVFPMDKPEYLVLVMVDEPKGNKSSYGFATAGWVAAPYAGNVIRDMAPLVGIRPERDQYLTAIKVKMGLATDSMQTQQGGRLASY